MSQYELSLEKASKLLSVSFLILDFSVADARIIRIKMVNTLSFIRYYKGTIHRYLLNQSLICWVKSFCSSIRRLILLLINVLFYVNISLGDINNTFTMEADKPELFPIKLDARAYRFFPKREEQKSAFEKKGTRFFFYGQIQHDEYELRKLRQFHEYVVKKQKKYDKEIYADEHLILQFLSANKYKPKETLKAMAEHAEFKRHYLPTLKVENVQKILKTGLYYPCGRDRHFRPVMVFKVALIDQKNVDPFFDAMIYTQETVIQNFFLPGQVQSWSIIYDLGGMGLTDLPLTSLKGILGKISLNYGGKLHKLWILNAPSGISTTWKIISTFLDDVTVEKIKISKQNTQKSIFDSIDPSQVEVKYGGTQPNRTEYFPFMIPNGAFDEKRLLSDLEYEGLLKQGKLKRNVIDPLFAQPK